jgi:hypothetical protein
MIDVAADPIRGGSPEKADTRLRRKWQRDPIARVI